MLQILTASAINELLLKEETIECHKLCWIKTHFYMLSKLRSVHFQRGVCWSPIRTEFSSSSWSCSLCWASCFFSLISMASVMRARRMLLGLSLLMKGCLGTEESEINTVNTQSQDSKLKYWGGKHTEQGSIKRQKALFTWFFFLQGNLFISHKWEACNMKAVYNRPDGDIKHEQRVKDDEGRRSVPERVLEWTIRVRESKRVEREEGIPAKVGWQWLCFQGSSPSTVTQNL